MTMQAVEKTKRGDGPLTVAYIDAANKEHKRVVAGASQLKVVVKGGKSKVYSISALSPAVREQLVLEAVKKRMDIFARNTVKDDAGADVLLATDAVYDMLKGGELYSRKEGGVGGPGKSFDFDRYIAIIKSAIANKAKNKVKSKSGNLVQPLTEKQLADIRTSIESKTPVERRKIVASYRSDPFFVLAEKEHDAMQAKKDIADGNFDETDLF